MKEVKCRRILNGSNWQKKGGKKIGVDANEMLF